MNILAIIPARYASTRFPGKPLAIISEKPMIQHVYQRVARILTTVVATDDQRIYDTVKNFGGNVVITKNTHESGTDRCAEALQLFEKQQYKSFDIVVNVQGDEPFIKKEQIEKIIHLFEKQSTSIATLVKKIDDTEELFNPNKVKVVINSKQEALYFSRSPIPYLRAIPKEKWIKNHHFFKHIGMYAYRKKTLLEITQLKKSGLEKAESLEQLRWLENNYSICTAETFFEGIAVDTPEDLEKIKNINL